MPVELLSSLPCVALDFGLLLPWTMATFFMPVIAESISSLVLSFTLKRFRYKVIPCFLRYLM